MRNFFTNAGGEGYDRPHDPYECGHTESGEACRFGPTPSGKCEHHAECQPLRSGVTFKCNRPEKWGGPCEAGPSAEGACSRVKHCKPMRSLRSKRRRLVSSVALLLFGAGLLLLGSRWSILNRTATQERCATCHPAGNESALGWIKTALHTSPGPTQTDLCVKCHTNLTPAEFATNPHTVASEALPEKTRATLAAFTHSIGLGAPDEVACSRCHQEHQGAEFDLKAITNARCQACHAEQFGSFAHGHPEFTSWPRASTNSVAFDHSSHADQHFAQKQQKFDCRSCHTASSTGEMRTSVGYDAACASCHDAALKASMTGGLALWNAPMIDADALRTAGADPGRWPAAAEGNFDGEFPALMKLLLAAEPESAKAFDKLGYDLNLFDLDIDDPAALRATAILAQASTRLLTELAGDPSDLVRRRMSVVLGREVKSDEAAKLVALLTNAQPQAAAATWYDGKPSNISESATGWRIDSAAVALKYQPIGHADPVLQAWLDIVAALPAERTSLRDAALAELAGPKSIGQCATCHTQSMQNQQFVWRLPTPSERPRPFTHFAHAPHVMLPELADCAACHARAAVTTVSTAQAQSDFAPLQKSTCVNCHQPHAAGDQCTQCHNYHVGLPSGMR